LSSFTNKKHLVKVVRIIEESGLYFGMYGETHVNKGDLIVADGLGFEFPITRSEYENEYIEVSIIPKKKPKQKRILKESEKQQMYRGYEDTANIIKSENEAREVLHIDSQELIENKPL
jgi:DNA primase large subunit